MFQSKVVQEIKTHFVFNKFFFLKNRPVYKIMWKNAVQQGRPQMTLRRMRIACWTPNAANTYSQYVMLIAFPLRQWLNEHIVMFRYMYTGCLVPSDKRRFINEDEYGDQLPIRKKSISANLPNTDPTRD